MNAAESTSRAALVAVLLLLTVTATLRAQASGGTSFPYRGTLVLDGQAIDTGGQPGRYDFSFRAYDRQQGGQAIGPVVEFPGLPLSEGRFEARLDFGTAVVAAGSAWIETVVVRRGVGSQADEIVAQSRQRVTFNTGSNSAGAGPGTGVGIGSTGSSTDGTAPVTSDAEILNRLSAVRVVISDRTTPGQAHFIVDEESFRRAFGVGTPVTTTDLSAVSLVAASQLRRELVVSREKERQLETEIDRLRFRLNLTLLLLAVVIVSHFVQRRKADGAVVQPAEDETGEAVSAAGSEVELPAGTHDQSDDEPPAEKPDRGDPEPPAGAI